MTDITKPEPMVLERTGWRATTRTGELKNLEVWALSAPVQLAGYEDDPAESHILRGID
ncbi:hypothetical protein AB0P12_00080 [Streptomyces subrutilus]|uniref:Uncharacterized protein n=1 Tax=Streptomyces subrutilus TaxID=36818 RepID=A0A918QQN1_9ACTN|nr:hypothetical protein [Streptomyces subrutilus]WSJ34431.1 hypothetical protein OG479_29180 [Streptomyces subrutilus]GGZ62502.1 hypothetical protein GCM10010371_22410 [Streptomyces subrutilus]